MFYVYEWYIVETGEIIYVGKGCRNRYKTTQHNKFFKDMIKRYKCESRIIKEFEKESDAYEYEHARTVELKAIGQCVCNIYLGGTGGTVNWWTPERREEYSKKNVMKTELQRRRMSENNPMKNADTKEKVRQHIIRAVYINGKYYESVKAAQIGENVSAVTISKWCKRGYDTIGNPCRYANESQKEIPEISKLMKYSKYCKHGNQQPILENSDNSIKDGSTTNR